VYVYVYVYVYLPVWAVGAVEGRTDALTHAPRTSIMTSSAHGISNFPNSTDRFPFRDD
jgi:hypothetical protein